MQRPRMRSVAALTALICLLGSAFAVQASATTPLALPAANGNGGTFTMAALAPPNPNLSPLMDGNAVEDLYYLDLAYDSLVHLNSDGSYSPELATSWHPNKDFTTWFFDLRKGVKFTDGSPFNAAEYVKFLKAFIAQEAGGDHLYVRFIKSVKATGPYGVAISLTQPDPDFVVNMATRMGVDPVGPKALGNPNLLNTTTDGTGPYMLDPSQTTPGTTYTFIPNPHYWDKSAVHFKKFVIQVIANPSTALNDMKTGQIEFMDGGYPLASSAKADGLEVEHVLSNWFGIYIWNRSGGPTGKLQVRQALNYATDRQAVTKTLFLQYGQPSDEISLPGYEGQGYDPALNNRYPYNPGKAKKLLAQAGYSKGFSINMACSPAVHNGCAMAQTVAAQWAQVGVKVNIQSYPTGTQLSPAVLAHKTPLFASGFGVVPFSIEMGQLLYPSGTGQQNLLNSSDPKLEALMATASKADTKASSAKALTAVEDWIVNNAWFDVTTSGQTLFFGAKGLKGDTLSARSYAPDTADFHF